jgi:K+-transporting ATPase ATPase A chain
MTYALDFLQYLLYAACLTGGAVLIGNLIGKIFNDEPNIISRIFRKPEQFIYRLLRVDARRQMTWVEYAVALCTFNVLGILIVLALQLVQQYLPFNPQQLPGVEFWLAFNTAVSFTTNTNWQAYAGETTMSYFTQMFGLTVQNFLSAATGIAVMLALARALKQKQGSTIGNFWNDVVKSTLYVLLPLSIIFSFILVSQGVVQSFHPAVTVSTVDAGTQTIPLGPAASQVAIKQIGTNGGGFFNANSAFPFENPTPFSNFLEALAILLLPAALVFTFGRITGARKHAWVLYLVMFVIFTGSLFFTYLAEVSTAPLFGGSTMLEGKELRFGVFQSVLWTISTTCASNGSVNAMISSISPIGGVLAMLNIQLGEIVFGGVGSGLYGIFLFILLTVFIAGLMVGRTPEYFGKKIGSYEIKWTICAILLPSVFILGFTAISVILPAGLSSLLHKGPHGFSEILYAFSSAAGNNGSAFAGLNANTTYYNATTALTMLVGRFGVIIPVLAISGSLVKKNISPVTAGSFKTDTALFGVLLLGIIIIVGALTFFPALSLGGIIEHFLVKSSVAF